MILAAAVADYELYALVVCLFGCVAAALALIISAILGK